MILAQVVWYSIGEILSPLLGAVVVGVVLGGCVSWLARSSGKC